MRILLTEDDLAVRAFVSRALEIDGHEVETAGDGVEAMECLERHDGQFDLLVSDVKMPLMDGIATLQLIKKGYPLVEVVMLTGDATIDSAIEAMKSGAFDYLVKPFDIDQLIDKITSAAKRKRDREAIIREVRSRPYISERERDELISRILDDA